MAPGKRGTAGDEVENETNHEVENDVDDDSLRRVRASARGLGRVRGRGIIIILICNTQQFKTREQNRRRRSAITIQIKGTMIEFMAKRNINNTREKKENGA